MKKLTILLLLASAISLSAANGDTSKVRTHDKVIIQTDPSKGFTNYAQWGKFPASGKRYHKMYCDLKFECPPGMTCGEWDYLNYIFIGKRRGAHNDTLNWEIMRMITPYGLQFANTWSHTWRFDITDFASLFTDSVEIMYQHTGYEAKAGRGWQITIDFTMIEGTEIKPVKNISMLYRKSVAFGNDSIFDARVPEISYTTGAETKEVRYKILQTGHGNDKPDGCGEFCAKTRFIVHDSAVVNSRLIWRDDCGLNPVFPQGGTWIYNRANWCPGAEVLEDNFNVSVAPNTKHTMDLDMESYTASTGGGNYMLTAYLIEYGAANFTTDATIWNIISPSGDSMYKRENPICGSAEIEIRNNGTKAIDYLDLSYGFRGHTQLNHWIPVHINPGEIKRINLPGIPVWPADAKYFDVLITKVNGIADDYPLNNAGWSKLPNKVTSVLSDKILVFFRTNNAPTENSYAFYDAGGNIYHKKSNFNTANFIYRDTVSFYNGCFKFNFQDTGVPPASYSLNRDGLGWWANSYDGTGTLQLRNAYTGKIEKTFNTDFGTSIIYSFTVGYAVNTNEITKGKSTLEIYPNPALNSVFIDLESFPIVEKEGASIEIIDMQGRIIYTVKMEAGFSLFQEINVENIPNGVYNVLFTQGNLSGNQKVIIQH